jgi:hypothetical protein
VHHPFGLIEPSTTAQVPLAVAVFPAVKNLQPEHFWPFLGVVWYLNCAFEPFAAAGIGIEARNPAIAGKTISPVSASRRLTLRSERFIN